MTEFRLKKTKNGRPHYIYIIYIYSANDNINVSINICNLRAYAVRPIEMIHERKENRIKCSY